MADLAEQLIDFAEAGNQQRISLTNGQVLQGWIMEINEQALLISTGFNENSGQDHWVELNQIDLTQLAYWDTQQQEWQAWTIHA